MWICCIRMRGERRQRPIRGSFSLGRGFRSEKELVLSDGRPARAAVPSGRVTGLRGDSDGLGVGPVAFTLDVYGYCGGSGAVE